MAGLGSLHDHDHGNCNKKKTTKTCTGKVVSKLHCENPNHLGVKESNRKNRTFLVRLKSTAENNQCTVLGGGGERMMAAHKKKLHNENIAKKNLQKNCNCKTVKKKAHHTTVQFCLFIFSGTSSGNAG